MNKREEALSTFNNGFNCAQAVFAAFAPDYGLNRDLALKVASGFGAGLGHQGKICGAVLGAYMVISLKSGSAQPNDELSKEITYHLTRKFDKEFENSFNSLICKDLLEADLSTIDGYAIALDKDLFNNRCSLFINETIAILEKLLETR